MKSRHGLGSIRRRRFRGTHHTRRRVARLCRSTQCSIRRRRVRTDTILLRCQRCDGKLGTIAPAGAESPNPSMHPMSAGRTFRRSVSGRRALACPRSVSGFRRSLVICFVRLRARIPCRDCLLPCVFEVIPSLHPASVAADSPATLVGFRKFFEARLRGAWPHLGHLRVLWDVFPSAERARKKRTSGYRQRPALSGLRRFRVGQSRGFRMGDHSGSVGRV